MPLNGRTMLLKSGLASNKTFLLQVRTPKYAEKNLLKLLSSYSDIMPTIKLASKSPRCLGIKVSEKDK